MKTVEQKQKWLQQRENAAKECWGIHADIEKAGETLKLHTSSLFHKGMSEQVDAIVVEIGLSWMHRARKNQEDAERLRAEITAQ